MWIRYKNLQRKVTLTNLDHTDIVYMASDLEGTYRICTEQYSPDVPIAIANGITGTTARDAIDAIAGAICAGVSLFDLVDWLRREGTQ